ncbi:unnamed protein product [Clonostachys rosea]|uniref:Xylanolytic transcriptional activator regulatory domain-containing protein n=1 Tax=Bionectria ochroleuca TaxID=29856 RepID=A0ABY6V2E3_BIOOC|nr:unnamed protein product [Clonostachys rosea]
MARTTRSKTVALRQFPLARSPLSNDPSNGHEQRDIGASAENADTAQARPLSTSQENALRTPPSPHSLLNDQRNSDDESCGESDSSSLMLATSEHRVEESGDAHTLHSKNAHTELEAAAIDLQAGVGIDSSGGIPLRQLPYGTGASDAAANQSRQNQQSDFPMDAHDQDALYMIQNHTRNYSPFPLLGTYQTETSLSPLPGSILGPDFELPGIQTAHVDSTTQTQPLSSSHREDFAYSMNPTSAYMLFTNPPAYLSQSDYAAAPAVSGNGIPHLRDTVPPSYPLPAMDDTAYAALRSDLGERLGVPEIEIDIPPTALCQEFLSSFAASFNCHMPIVHLPTWRPSSEPSPLVLAMCSIGALYRLDHSRARRIYDVALRSVKKFPSIPRQIHESPSMFTEHPRWYVQARILLSYFSIMSGDSELVSDTLLDNGFYTLVYSAALASAAERKTRVEHMSWQEWAEHESWNRTLGAIFIVSTLTMVMYDVNPGCIISRNLRMEPFAEEALWAASTDEEWRRLRVASSAQRGQVGSRTLKDILVDLMTGHVTPLGNITYLVSPFSAVVLMHAVVVHMWQRFQVSQGLSDFWGSSASSTTDSNVLSAAFLDNTMQSLARCELFIRRGRDAEFQTGSDLLGESSLVSECEAMLTIAHTRLFHPAIASVRFGLTDSDPSETNASIRLFVTENMDRNLIVLELVAKCLDGLKLPVSRGGLKVQRKVPMQWGAERAVAGWESALLVTKWTHVIEMDLIRDGAPNIKELELLNNIKGVLAAAEYDLAESISLAAGVARTWSRLLQNVCPWGFVPRECLALEQLALAYEEVRKAERRNSIVASEYDV